MPPSSVTLGPSLQSAPSSSFDWIERNGPAPLIEPHLVSIDIYESLAVVQLEVRGWSGILAGSGVRMTDIFTLLRKPDGWTIIQKAFHWHG